MSDSCPKCKAGPSYIKPLYAAGGGTSYICRSCNATWPDQPNHVHEVNGMAQDRVCNSCRGALNEDSKFCPACGASVETPSAGDCPSCGEKNAPDSKYCDKCGSLMSKPVAQAGYMKELASAFYDNEGLHQIAINEYDKAIEQNPSDPLNYFYKAVSHEKLRHFGRASTNYDKAIKANTANPILGDYLALAFQGLASNQLMSGSYEEAIQNAGKAIELNPASSINYHTRGYSYFYKEDNPESRDPLDQYKKAIQELNKAIELDPQSPHYYSVRARAYEKLEQYEEAIKDFSKAIELHPQNLNINTYRNRAWVYEALGQPYKAQLDFDKALELEDLEWNRRAGFST